jgi:AcrR family transcriptional regulator
MTSQQILPAVLHSAERLFSQQGFVATSLEEIAVHANVRLDELGLNKDDLLWYSALGIADAFQQALEDTLAVPRPIDDRLRYAIMAHVNVIVENLSAANVYMHEWRYLSEARRADYLKRRDTYEKRFRQIVREGIHAGMFSPIDEKFVTMMLLGSLNWVSQWYNPQGPMRAGDVARNIADVLLNGLYRHV